MALDYSIVKNWPFEDIAHAYGWKDSALYALSLGMGGDLAEIRELSYVYEQEMRSFPTMAVVLAHPGFWVRNPATGIDWKNAIHVEQRLALTRPLPVEGSVTARTRVRALIDKGSDKGALMVSERQLRDTRSGVLYGNVIQVSLLRGDGGFSASGFLQDESLQPLEATPKLPPDIVCALPTAPASALLYRLNGDFNPLHADPKVAHEAGFDRPILHGLCTYGIAARAIVRTCLDGDAARLIEFSARFSSPVYPGETLRTEIWREEERIQFRCVIAERDAVVLSNGLARAN